MQNTKNGNKNMKKINHEGSFGKMEVDAIREMFARSEQLHGVKYTNYYTLETEILKHSRVSLLLNLTEITSKYIKKSESDTCKNEWVSENVKKKIKVSVDGTN